jgi:hypothetical protein
LYLFSDLIELQQLGFIYFIYLFLYSGLEFTLTFLTHHTFNYTSMQQGWMFFVIGLTMAIMQGGYVRRLPEHKIKPTAVLVSTPTNACSPIGVNSFCHDIKYSIPCVRF